MRFNTRRQLLQLCIRIGQRIAHFNLRIKQVQQQTVAIGEIVFRSGANRIFQQRHTVQTELSRYRRRLANVVRLNRTGGYQRISAFTQRVCGEKFQLTQLIAAHGHRRDVIAFDENIAPEVVGKAWKIFERCWRANKFQTWKAR